jgi:hypothetical protein
MNYPSAIRNWTQISWLKILNYANICNVVFFFQCQVMGRKGRPAVQYRLCQNSVQIYLCSKHFVKSDFCTSERVGLNRVAVPHDSDSPSHSAPQTPVPWQKYIALDNCVGKWTSFLSLTHYCSQSYIKRWKLTGLTVYRPLLCSGYPFQLVSRVYIIYIM